MSVKAEDVEKALAILRSWKTAARSKGNMQAQTDVAHVERVLRGLTGR